MIKYKPIFLLIVLFPFGLSAQYDLKKTVERTDSSIITTYYQEWEGKKTIKIYNDLKKELITYFTELYPDTKTVKTIGKFYSDYETRIGQWNHYTETGVLKRTDDYSNGNTISYLKNDTINYLFNNALQKADSFLISYFGSTFFEHNIQFDANKSDWNTGSYDWFENRGDKNPYNFLFVYNIVLDNEYFYPTIEFWIDSNGFSDIRGFTDCVKHNNCEFNLNYQNALTLAKTNGLKLKKDKYFAELKWIKPPLDSINGQPDYSITYKGKYEFMVASYNRKEKVGNENFVQIFGIYDAIFIDPWTGKYLRKDEIRRVLSWWHPKGGHGGSVR
jgi:hypothetical protein